MRPIWAIAALLASTASGSAAEVAPPASRRRFDDPDRWDGQSIGGGWMRFSRPPRPTLAPSTDEQRRRLAQARDKRARKAERRRYCEARSAGHHAHCAARIAYGDGEPECVAAWPYPWAELVGDGRHDAERHPRQPRGGWAKPCRAKPAKATRVDVRDESYTSDPDEGGGW